MFRFRCFVFEEFKIRVKISAKLKGVIIMKKSVAITTIVALHAAAIGMLLIQAGCSSDAEASKPGTPPVPEMAKTTEIAVPDESSDINTPPPEESLPPEGSLTLRSDPTRPAAKESPSINEVDSFETVKPAEPAKPAQTPDESVAIYKVRKGDSISRIAKSHGISQSEIMELNSLTSKSILKIGQEIKLPASSKAPVQPAPQAADMQAANLSLETEKYVVVKGDSLSRIASKRGTTVAQIMATNNLKNHNIRIGQKLILPKGNPSGKASPEVRASGAEKISEGEIKYTVKSGDYLGMIAKRYGTTVSAISERNNISDPRKIRVGQILIIKAPKSAAGASAKNMDTKQPQPQEAAAQLAPAPESKTQTASAPVEVQADEEKPSGQTAEQTSPKSDEPPPQANPNDNMPIIEI